MATSCTDFDHPYYKELSEKNDKERIEFFTESKGKKMKHVSLGEALDFISGGGGNFVFYPLGPKDMTKYIRTWMGAQEPKIDYEKVVLSDVSYKWKEIGREYFYLWNRFHQERPLENGDLPRINYDGCPRRERGHNHKETIEDRFGRVRCSEKMEAFEKRPSFTKTHQSVDFLSATPRYSFWEDEPQDLSFYDETDEEEGVNYEDLEYNEYILKKEKFDNEDPIKIVDNCYAIIKEPADKYLPLETVLSRLNCSHVCDSSKEIVLPFSGFTLAEYVHAWWNQPGRKRVWKKKNELDFHNHFSDFKPFSMDD